MRHIFITSDKYQFCLKGLQQLIKKHWNDPSAKFTIIGFSEPDVKILDGFEFIKLGENFNDNTPWFETLTPYLNQLEDDYFFLGLEDHFPIQEVDIEYLKKASQIMEKDEKVMKIRLYPKYDSNTTKGDYNEDFYIAKTHVNSYIPTSLRPAIWRKEFFLRLLGTSASPHHFEVNNNSTEFSDLVLIPKVNHAIYTDCDAMRCGIINEQTLRDGLVDMGYYTMNLSKEDLLVFDEVREFMNKRI